MQKSISVVIPNYNGRDLLSKNLPSVYVALRQVNAEHEVIVVDDASSDDSVSLLRNEFKDVIVLVNEINRGFSPTINKGIIVAKKDLVLLLNSDVVLTPDFFKPLMPYFENNDTFGVSARFIGLNDDIIQDAGKYPELLLSGKIQPYNFYVDQPEGWVPTLFVSGGGGLIDRAKLQRLEGFNEIFAPFYVEDMDLSIRAWEAGWKCYYEHEAICRHPVAATIGRFHVKKSIWIITHRNKLILHDLHLSRTSKMIWNFRQAITLVIQGIAFRWKYHKAFLLYLGKRPQIRESKKRQQMICGNNIIPIEKIMKSMRREIDRQKKVRI
jgi:GT2 family glycosyltransferase